MKNKLLNCFALTAIVGGGIGLFSYYSVRQKNAWLYAVKEGQPILPADFQTPYSPKSRERMMRVMNELPILPNWTTKEANEIKELLELPYPERAIGENPTFEERENLAVITQTMGTIDLRMGRLGPVDPDAAKIIKDSLILKLQSWSHMDRRFAIATLTGSGFMIQPDVLLAAQKVADSDENPEVKRLAERNIRISKTPEYVSFWTKASQKRGF